MHPGVQKRNFSLFYTHCIDWRNGLNASVQMKIWLDALDKPCAFEYANVLPEPAEQHAMRRREIANAICTAAECVELGAPGRVGECGKHAAELSTVGFFMHIHQVSLGQKCEDVCRLDLTGAATSSRAENCLYGIWACYSGTCR